MGLFTDIYNTVAKFFRSQDEQSADDPSKSIAQNRLKLVLMQDRTNLTPKVLEQMRGEMIELLSKYLEMDKDLLELNFEQDGNQVALMLSIPVIRAKDEEEIEAAMKNSDETDEFEDESEDDNYEEDDSDTIDLNEEENLEDIEVTEEVKPKKRHSKKVSAPSELSGNDENNNEEMNSEENSEQTEQNTVCEQSEG